MSSTSTSPLRHPRGLLLTAGACALALGVSLLCGPVPRDVRAASAELPEAALPQSAAEAVSTHSEPVESPSTERRPTEPPRATLAAWLEGLAAELAHEPYQSRAFRERLEGCLASWSPALQDELEQLLAAPPQSDAQLAALASLGRARALRLSAAPSAALWARLRSLALREDSPFGVAVESARSLVASGGIGELGWWCAALENARDARSRSIAAGALEALHDAAGSRFLLERALEQDEPLTAGRLLDVLGRALENGALPQGDPGRQAAAWRLAQIAEDAHAAPELRAHALGVLRGLDAQESARLASEWFLDPDVAGERLEFAAHSLRGAPGAGAALRSAQADPRLDQARLVLLAECLLFTPPDDLRPEAREDALAQMRTTLHEGHDPAARRRALHALARFGAPDDRAQVERAAETDSDLLARAAARSSLMREASEWR